MHFLGISSKKRSSIIFDRLHSGVHSCWALWLWKQGRSMTSFWGVLCSGFSPHTLSNLGSLSVAIVVLDNISACWQVRSDDWIKIFVRLIFASFCSPRNSSIWSSKSVWRWQARHGRPQNLLAKAQDLVDRKLAQQLWIFSRFLAWCQEWINAATLVKRTIAYMEPWVEVAKSLTATKPRNESEQRRIHCETKLSFDTFGHVIVYSTPFKICTYQYSIKCLSKKKCICDVVRSNSWCGVVSWWWWFCMHLSSIELQTKIQQARRVS